MATLLLKEYNYLNKLLIKTFYIHQIIKVKTGTLEMEYRIKSIEIFNSARFLF